MALFQDVSYNKSFSQLAKESNFTFNLYRGRVDWRKLEMLDVDRVVRDQDVELLNIHINSVTNCNLESEYDVKILDPNFIKLFRLAQLLIDFLLHCKQYLEHCIKVAYESLQASNKEVEILRRQVQARKSEVKQLKKKVKEVKQLFHSPRFPSPTFECSLCGKCFMNEKYLESHHSRRHIFNSYSLALKPLNQPGESHKVSVAKEENKNEHNLEDVNLKNKYQEEIEELKSVFFAEIEKLKQNEGSKKQIEKANNKHSDIKTANNDKTVSSEKGNSDQASERTEAVEVTVQPPTGVNAGELEKGRTSEFIKKVEEGVEEDEEWKRRLEERESVWRARLSALDQHHKRQVHQLQERLDSSHLQGQEMKKDLERRLEEVLGKFELSQALLESKNQSTIKEDKNQEYIVSRETSTATRQNEKKLLRIQLEEGESENNLKHPPPHFQKRIAFVSQKTKTIQDQDSIELSQVKQSANDSVKMLQIGNESEDESNSGSTKNTSKESVDYARELGEKKLPSFIQPKSKISEQTSRSKNKESIITKLLEEEKLKSITKQNRKSGPILVENDESSISETLTDTESETETSEEKQSHMKSVLTDVRQTGIQQNVWSQIDLKQTDASKTVPKQTSKTFEEQMVSTDTQLAQQSLQSMEALLSANPTILQQLRGDLQELVGRRLRGLGMDPDWAALPSTTFRNKMAVLAHQRQITAKNHKVYFTLRDKLNQDADTAVRSRPTQSTADSLLARLRKKAALVVNAAKFTRHTDRVKNTSPAKPNSLHSNQPQPLASSSPQTSPKLSATLSTKKGNTTFTIPNVQSEDSLSLSSSTSEEAKKDGVGDVTYSIGPTATSDTGSYKSALRNAVSTGNLAKKKVLFVDEAFKNDKRSLSEDTVATSDSFATRLDSVSVSSLVQEIQLQLSRRSGKPAHAVDLTQPAELPLSQILPLTRSGRELLESQPSSTLKFSSSLKSSTNISPSEKISEPLSHMLQKVPATKQPKLTTYSEKGSPRTLEPLSQTLQKVPLVKSSPLPSLGKNSEFPESSLNFKKPSSKNLLQPPKFSPTHSLTSIGSSLDISFSPRDRKGSLELDLQDLEDNLKD